MRVQLGQPWIGQGLGPLPAVRKGPQVAVVIAQAIRWFGQLPQDSA